MRTHTHAHTHTHIALQHNIGDDNNIYCVYLYLEDNRKIYIDHDDKVVDILENDEQVSVPISLGNNYKYKMHAR